MNKPILSLCTLILFLAATTTYAIPSKVKHQGRILGADTTPITGSSNVIFKLYASENSNSSIWTQTLSVTFDNGYYSVELGPGNPVLSHDIFDGSERWLGITLEGSNEFLPRSPIVSVPYAFMAGAVNGGVKAVGGLTVDGQQLFDNSGTLNSENLNVSNSLTLPQGDISDLPEASESNTGQLYYATDEQALYFSNGSEWVNVGSGTSDLHTPNISGISPTNMEPGEDTEITIEGSFFEDGCEIYFGDSPATSVTFNNSGSITAMTGTELESGVHYVRITNPSNLRFTLWNGLTVDASPVWNTSEGSLGVIVDSSTGDHITLDVTDPEGEDITFAVTSGSLPPGLSLNPDTGVIFGDPDDVNEDTEYTFTISATDTAQSVSTRAFSITISDMIGQTQESPGDSCKHILDSGSSVGDGIYWLDPNGGDHDDAFQAECDMTTDGGGWTPTLAVFPQEDGACPGDWGLHNTGGSGQICRRPNDNCGAASAFFDVGVSYQEITGYVAMYNFGSSDGFGDAQGVAAECGAQTNIDHLYVDGVSITYDDGGRQHIWTYALDHSGAYCGSYNPPSFANNQSTCRISTTSSSTTPGTLSYTSDDTFTRTLDAPTTSPIEIRILSGQRGHSNEDAWVKAVELWVR